MLPVEGDLIAGRYRIERKIGQGGLGAVFAAHDGQSGQRVVLKVLLPTFWTDENSIGRFAREARASLSLTSEHSVRVYDVGYLANGAPFIVMEHLYGENLGDIIEAHGRLRPAIAVEYIMQAIHGLAEAHTLGIVHRDIKPENLFLSKGPDGVDRVKVLDFGLAKAPDAEESKLSVSADCLGTPEYMAPEQIRGSAQVDHRADVWALGACLYEMLTGEAPFAAGTVADVLVGALIREPVPPDQRAPNVPPMLSAIVLGCLEKEPDARIPDVVTLAAALAQVHLSSVFAHDAVTLENDWNDASTAGISLMAKKKPAKRGHGLVLGMAAIVAALAATISIQQLRVPAHVPAPTVAVAARAVALPPVVEPVVQQQLAAPAPLPALDLLPAPSAIQPAAKPAACPTHKRPKRLPVRAE